MAIGTRSLDSTLSNVRNFVQGPELLNKPLNKTEPTMPNKANGCRLTAALTY
jgi:hypothetical protein